jgi:CCR4-NOT transcription complex subunit 2
MSELDRFGLAGLLGMMRHDSNDVAGLAVGQDLTTLGLDLNQPEYVIMPRISNLLDCSNS